MFVVTYQASSIIFTSFRQGVGVSFTPQKTRTHIHKYKMCTKCIQNVLKNTYKKV